MNFVFLSPHFPPNWAHFVTALKAAGANVLGLGDCPYQELSPHLTSALTEYYYVHDMHDYDSLLRAVGHFTHRYGKIDRIESLNEYWLAYEARLREDFNVMGQKPADTDQNRSKLGMKAFYRQAGLTPAAGEAVKSIEQVRAFGQQHGYPLVLKPDVGIGAARTYKVESEAQLANYSSESLSGYIVEAFVDGQVISFDGIADRNGQMLFYTSHEYSSGVMDIVNEQLPVHFYSMRDISPTLIDYGQKVLDAFGLKERFFHLEFFRTGPDSYVPLEVNFRPPGGYIIDMMNFSCDLDLYRIWAELLVRGTSTLEYQRLYHVAHCARRYQFSYALSHQQVLARFGEEIVMHISIPPIFATAMGDYLYILRNAELESLQHTIAQIEEQV